MSVYMTENEQIDVIKKWWQRYSNIITIIVSLVLLSVSAYKYWFWYEDKRHQQASDAYEHMMLAFSNKDDKGVRSYANQLVTEFSKSVYADAARLTLAKILVSHAEYVKARDQLEFIVQHSKVGAFQQVAKIRLARLLIAEKNYDKALQALSQITEATYLPIVSELKGDIFAVTGRYKEALASYKEANNQVQLHGIGNLFLEMKTNELAAFT